jgi:hypothetical protein
MRVSVPEADDGEMGIIVGLKRIIKYQFTDFCPWFMPIGFSARRLVPIPITLTEQQNLGATL